MTARAKPDGVRGEVVPLRPALLKDRAAAEYMARSASWIRAARAIDTKLRREGKEPTGPRWITIGQSVFYRLQDLDQWIAQNSVDRGVVTFANRGAGGAETDDPGAAT